MRGWFAVAVLVSAVGYGQAVPSAKQSFHDRRAGVSFDVPAGWTLSTKDGEVSTFHLDARSAPRGARMRAVVSIGANPFPLSTFAGAFVYFSVTPGATDASCAKQAVHSDGTREVAGQSFARGHEEQESHICTESRDEIYVAYRKRACYRFDLVTNTFCAAVSGAKEMTAEELEDVRKRMEGILDTAKF